MPRRREFLTATSAEGGGRQESIYIPERHQEKDRAFIASFLNDYSFAMVVTAKGGPRVTNVPTLYEPSSDPKSWGKIWWHIAKANGQNEAINPSGEALVVFHGPHSYISPNWYAGKNAVPTWNFAVVHASGTANRLDDDAYFAAQLANLVSRNESKYAAGEKSWALQNLPDSNLKGMRQGIVAYEMEIESVEAKFKLGQERSDGDRAGILTALRADKGAEPNLLSLTERYYKRMGKG